MTVRIPPTLDVHAIPFNVEPTADPVINIGYSGTPVRKDLFDNFLEGIMRFDPQGRKVRFRVAGITPEQLLVFPAIRSRGHTTIPQNIETIGKASQFEAISFIRQAEF